MAINRRGGVYRSDTSIGEGITAIDSAIDQAEAAQLAAEQARDAALVAQTAAELAETNAETAETNAETAQLAAEAARDLASGYASDADADRIAAEAAKLAAEAARDAAQLAETNAETAETNAKTAETNAQTAQGLAEAARDAAQLAYDNFDDRYLGEKASNPTLDNDGNALVVGALYFNTTSSEFRGYNGTSWISLPATTATNVTFSATGNIAATNVQTAIAEVDTEKVAKAGDTMTGPLVIPAGTSSVPSLSFDGDPNTGIYSPSADTVNITQGGVIGLAVGANIVSYKNQFVIKDVPIQWFYSAGSVNKWYIGANISDSVNGGIYIGNDATFGSGNILEIQSTVVTVKGSADFCVGRSSYPGVNSGVAGASITDTGQVSLENNYTAGGNLYCNVFNAGTNTVTHVYFARNNSFAGTISTNSSGSTSYNTTSDYRLKEQIVPLANGLERLMKLSPKRFAFKMNPEFVIDGFLAHEVQEIVPEAVVGEKDGEEYQQMDVAKLVPLLVAAVQELTEKVRYLESKL